MFMRNLAWGGGKSTVDEYANGQAIVFSSGQAKNFNNHSGLRWSVDATVMKNEYDAEWDYAAEMAAINLNLAVEPYVRIGPNVRLYPRLGLGATHWTIEDTHGRHSGLSTNMVIGGGVSWVNERVSIDVSMTRLDDIRTVLALSLRVRIPSKN